MILGAQAIKDAFDGPWRAYRTVGGHEMQVAPHDLRVGPNSVDVTLSNAFYRPRIRTHIDPRRVFDASSLFDRVIADEVVLGPGECTLGSTRERFYCTPPFHGRTWVCHYDGRSTIGRLFLASHVTAAFGDYGFSGYWTLEIVNHSPASITLFDGMRIGQVYFTEVLMPREYDGAYANQDQRAEPRLPVLGVGRV